MPVAAAMPWLLLRQPDVNIRGIRVASIKYVTEQLIVVGRRLQDASDFFRRQLIRLHTIW